MAGQIRKLLDTIVEKRSKGNPTIALTTKTKLIFKGFDPDNFNAGSPDDPAAIQKIKAIAVDLGVSL
ncbi:MAG: hypothetical protein ABSF46_01650 [Terriglobia bacterium]|jgi:hypothetical protein